MIKLVTAIWETQMEMMNVKHNRTEPQIYYCIILLLNNTYINLQIQNGKLFFLTKLLFCKLP